MEFGLFCPDASVVGEPPSNAAFITVLVGVIVQVAVCYRVFIKRQTVRLPEEYFFYVPLLGMMILSLTYAPNLAGGLDKLLRFVCLTGIGIVAPFVLFDDLRKIGRFFFVLILGGLGLAINSMTMLGVMAGDAHKRRVPSVGRVFPPGR